MSGTKQSVKTVDGTCPTCDGEATIFPFPGDSDEGHIYCDEDDCGWIHRHLSGTSRYTDSDSEYGEEDNQL